MEETAGAAVGVVAAPLVAVGVGARTIVDWVWPAEAALTKEELTQAGAA